MAEKTAKNASKEEESKAASTLEENKEEAKTKEKASSEKDSKPAQKKSAEKPGAKNPGKSKADVAKASTKAAAVSDDDDDEEEADESPAKASEKKASKSDTKKKSAKAKSKKKPNILVRMGRGIVRFFKDTKGEMKRVVWPSRKQVGSNLVVVLLFTVLMAVLIFLVDLAFASLFKLGMDLAAGGDESAVSSLPTVAAAILPYLHIL